MVSKSNVERLKKDKNETLHYRTKLLKQGKNTLAAKMLKKIYYIDQHLAEMESVA